MPIIVKSHAARVQVITDAIPAGGTRARTAAHVLAFARHHHAWVPCIPESVR